MLRLKRLYFVLIIAAVFFTGVYCGTRWNHTSGQEDSLTLRSGGFPKAIDSSTPQKQTPASPREKLFPPSENPAAANSETAIADSQHANDSQGNKAFDQVSEERQVETQRNQTPAEGNAGTEGTGQNPVFADIAPNVHPMGAAGGTQAQSGQHAAIPAVSPASPKASSLVSGQASLLDKTPFSPSPSSFSLHRMGNTGEPTLLIIGGIQGDEPGGFSAAALISTHYTITKGSVWVVPDLNFASILQRGRGVFGDMNRKFAELDPNDPEYEIIMQIKKVLLNEQVSLVLNLHDGSGFYRPTWEDDLRNPKRWGQSVIIDQEEINAPRFNLLYETARKVEAEVNTSLIDPVHRYHIHNTLTAKGNTEMAKTLSYFAICNGKPAFGVEASKEFSTEYRAYYHLNVIEAFMRQMGIEFERDFELSPTGVLAALNSNLALTAYNNKWMLQLDNVRPSINMLPFKKDAKPDVRASKPLLTLVPDQSDATWRIAYGNRTLARVNPEFMDFDDSLDSMEMILDGTPYSVRPGALVTVKNSFLVKSRPGFRVNAIGAQKEKDGSEADVTIERKDFIPRFSLDKGATTYRVEIYKNKAFAGMVLVRFGDEGMRPHDAVPLTATAGPETELGF